MKNFTVLVEDDDEKVSSFRCTYITGAGGSMYKVEFKSKRSITGYFEISNASPSYVIRVIEKIHEALRTMS